MFENSCINLLVNDKDNDQRSLWLIEIQILQFLSSHQEHEEQSKLSYLNEIFESRHNDIIQAANTLYKTLIKTFDNCYTGKGINIKRNMFNIYSIELLNYLMTQQMKFKQVENFYQLNRQLLTNSISIRDYTAFLRTDLKFDLERSIGIANTVYMAHDRIKKFCSGIISNVYYFEFIQPKIKCCEFCSINKNNIFLISDVLALHSKHVKPAFIFGGKLECTGYWEPDPLYKIN
jgi:hypothetical protein